jgi:large subunit ribosomal protein L21e
MVRHKGLRKKSRKKLRKHPRMRGLGAITRSLQDFPIGEKVVILLDPSQVKGMPHPRFHGKTGVVVEKRGKAYVVQVREGDKIKKVIARPEHLKRWYDREGNHTGEARTAS